MEVFDTTIEPYGHDEMDRHDENRRFEVSEVPFAGFSAWHEGCITCHLSTASTKESETRISRKGNMISWCMELDSVTEEWSEGY